MNLVANIIRYPAVQKSVKIWQSYRVFKSGNFFETQCTSSFLKQTAAMLEFYFRYRFSRLRHHRHAILHLPTKFRSNRIIRNIVMTSYPFPIWQPRHRNSTSCLVFRDLVIWEGHNLPADQISATYINRRQHVFASFYFIN